MTTVTKITMSALAAVYMIAAAQTIVVLRNSVDSGWTRLPTLAADAVLRPELYALR